MNNTILPLLTDELNLPYYLTAVGGTENQEHILRTDGYPNYHWLYCEEGKGKLILNDMEYIIEKNMGVFLFPDVPHEYYPLEKPWKTTWIVFDGYEVNNLMKILGFNKSEPHYVQENRLISRLVNDIYMSAKTKGHMRGNKCSYFLYTFLLELRNCSNSSTVNLTDSMHYMIQPVISLIEENYNLSPTLEEMSNLIGVSKQYLCRAFRHALNMRPFEYLTRIRIQKAKEILIDTKVAQIVEIAKSVGYNDSSYFCSIFRRYEGITPLEFRRRYFL